MPDVDETPLLRWMQRKSDAHPIEVKEIRGKQAVVGTTEYWYLRWWSTVEQRYRYPYRETNRHICLLVNTPDGWLVEENIQPAPRSSTPHRQHK